MSSKLKNGYTKIANDLLEKIIVSGLNGTELAVILLVIRKTYGWNKLEDEISLSQFIKYIPVSKKSICSALKVLLLVKIVTLVKKGCSCNSSNKYKLNKKYDEWQLVKKSKLVKKTPRTSEDIVNQLVKKTTHTKETIQKKLYKRKDSLFFSDPSFKDLWESFVDMRKKMRKPLTDKAISLTMSKFEKWGIEESKQSLEKTIECGWTGLFEPKTKGEKDAFEGLEN